MYEYSVAVLERQLTQATECFLEIEKTKNKVWSVVLDRNEILRRIQDLKAAINKLKEWN